ncbi:CDK2-associated and cullin domain-containing protein 1 isoform X2 [Phycodurus eques]|uniref:CDK2-associated and cullin domain-containing protein 1 isoform X2 n=1 Tax=Phycodurus eques TaxID=693459 RepID=UPI002ACE2044|nr:CDK2-associated and cullin domain-containing protein 1 isoform X2 [Phycodurus eques]
MEAMDDDGSDVKDDHNHNYCASSSGAGGSPRGSLRCHSASGSKFMDSDSGSERGETECASPAAASAEDKHTLDSTSNFLLNAIAVEDYRNNHWPNLEKAIERLLIQNPTDHISVSYAQIYSCVYKCVCQQHSELLYNDLKSKIANYLQRVSTELHNKFYIESKLNRDLKQDLMNLFADHVADKYVNTLMPLLTKAHAVPFEVQPSTMASVVKGLHSLRPEWAQLAPALFSNFIPQINPPAMESLLLDYAAHDQKLQMELSMNGFPRGDQSRKRANDDS